jgi:hypothetical protein
MLLQQLLCGILVGYSRDALEAETQSILRLHNSTTYRNNLAKILDVFHSQQKHLKGPLNGKSGEFGKTLTTICCR